MGLDDSATSHVHQVPAEHVRGKKHLARASLEGACMERVGAEPHLSWCELVDVLHPDIDVAAADSNLDSRHWRIAALAELHYEVLEPAQLVARRVEHRAVQELREHQPALFPLRPTACSS